MDYFSKLTILVLDFLRPKSAHGAYIGTLGLMECKKYVLDVIRKH